MSDTYRSRVYTDRPPYAAMNASVSLQRQIKLVAWWYCRARWETGFGHSVVTRSSKFTVLL